MKALFINGSPRKNWTTVKMLERAMDGASECEGCGFPNDAEMKALRERYPAGTRSRLIHMADDIAPVPPGMIGSVAIIDDAGNIHMNWENGRSLALIEDVDEFEVIIRG